VGVHGIMTLSRTSSTQHFPWWKINRCGKSKSKSEQ